MKYIPSKKEFDRILSTIKDPNVNGLCDRFNKKVDKSLSEIGEQLQQMQLDNENAFEIINYVYELTIIAVITEQVDYHQYKKSVDDFNENLHKSKTLDNVYEKSINLLKQCNYKF